MGRRLAGMWAMSAPSRWSEPESAVSRPAMMRRSVVLPQPEGPRRVMNSPEWMEREMSQRTGVLANDLRRASTRRRGGDRLWLEDVMGCRDGFEKPVGVFNSYIPPL